MSADIADNTLDGLQAPFKRAIAQAEGKGSGGIVPKLFTEEDTKEIDDQFDEAKQEYEGSEEPEVGTYCKLAYTAAAKRDVAYCSYGRKYMLALGLTKKCMTVGQRAAIVASFGYKNE